MFNGSIPIVLDTLKQHYFIDRDGKTFRHILNYLRSGKLTLPDSFDQFDQLIDEARYYDLGNLMKEADAIRLRNTRPVCVKKEATEKNGGSGGEFFDCIAVGICPELGERISLSADIALIEEVFPELNAALTDSRNSGWHMENRYVIRFPLNGFCKLNSVQVLQRLFNHGFKVVASTGGGVEGQQFSEYLFTRSCKAVL